MNKFDQLVEDLKTGALSLTHIQIAIRAWVRERDDLPDEIKDLLAGRGESFSGIIYKQMRLVREIIGTVELAFNRGHMAGGEDKEKS